MPADFTGTYIFHCHVLQHEDMGMMAAISVSAPDASGQCSSCMGYDCSVASSARSSDELPVAVAAPVTSSAAAQQSGGGSISNALVLPATAGVVAAVGGLLVLALVVRRAGVRSRARPSESLASAAAATPTFLSLSPDAVSAGGLVLTPIVSSV